MNTSNSKIRGDVLGGLTTFFTMLYIVVVNPSILATEGTGMSFSGVLTATVLLCFSMTLLMGLIAKLPFAVAPGMGINAFFTYTVILGMGVHWTVALGMVFWAGVIFLLVSVTPLREKIAQAIPHHLRISLAVGIGVFLTFIGLKNASWIVASPATFVKIAPLNTEMLLAFFGLLLMIVLHVKRWATAFIIGIFSVTFLALALGKIHAPEQWLSTPDFDSVFLKVDIWGALKLSLLPAIVSLFFTDLFDSLSTFIGVSHACDMVDKEGQPKYLKQGLIVDALATWSASLFGTSAGTAYIESAAGIKAGARSGLASVVTAFCFLPCLFISPLAAIIPSYATAPVLILVGWMMFQSVGELQWKRVEQSIPSFLTILLIPLTFSITQGILWGFISHVTLHVLVGKQREIPFLMWILALISVLLVYLSH